MAAAALVVRFDPPIVGILPLEASSGPEKISLEASYVPNDFLTDLVTALSLVTTTQGRWFAIANAEPTEVELFFNRAAWGVKLTIKRDNSECEPFTFEGSVREVILPFWRALRRLQHDEEFLSIWKGPFPHMEMKRLSERVGTIKAQAG